MNPARYTFRALVSVLLFMLLVAKAGAQSPAGREFIVVLPALMDLSEMQKDIAHFTIEVYCSRRTNVALWWADGRPLASATVEAGLRATFTRPLFAIWQVMQSSVDLDREIPNRRALVVTADQPVTVQAMFDTNYRAENYQVLPVSSYDTVYTVVNFAGWSGSGDRTGLVIMASQDNTDVRILPSVQTWAGHMPNVEYTVHLNHNEVYQVVSTFKSRGPVSDVTGTVIRSNKPVGVMSFSAASCTPTHGQPPPESSPPGQGPMRESNYSVKPLIEYQISENRAGTTFYAMPLLHQDPSLIQQVNKGWPLALGRVRSRRDSSVLRFAALQFGTTFDTNGVRLKTSAGADSTFTRGQHLDLIITGPMKVVASKPVVAMEFAVSGRDVMSYDVPVMLTTSPDTTYGYVEVPYGNPSMVYLPPVSEYRPNLQVSIPMVQERPEPVFFAENTNVRITNQVFVSWHHYLIITAPTTALGQVKLNGVPITFNYVHRDAEYMSSYQRVVPGLRQLIESPVPVSCISYGMTWYDSYATVGAESIRSFAKVAPDTLRFFSCDAQKDTTVTLSDLGAGDFQLDSVRVSGVNATLLSPAALPVVVAANGQLKLLLQFQTPLPTVYSGTIRLYTDANNQSVLEVPFIITRDSAKLGLPATTIDFGVLKASQSQRDTSIILTNNGARPLVITAVTFLGTGYQLIGATFPDTIAPGKADTLLLRFTPAADGLREASMRIVGTPCLQSVDVALRGFKGSGATALVGRTLLYASYLCDAPAEVDSVILFRSIGDEPIVISTAAIDGLNKDEFKLLDSLAGRSVAPGDTLRIHIRYVPSGYGQRRAVLKLTTNAKNAAQIDIDLVARKDTVTLVSSTDTLRFGTVLSCGNAPEQIVTIRNTGTIADTITALDLGGVTAYVVGTSLPVVLNPFTSQDIRVRFAPALDGAFPTVLHLEGTPCNVEAAVALFGGRATPALSATAVNFDTVYECENVVRSVIVTNTGTVPDTLRGVSDGAGVFRVQGGTFPHELAPGASDTLTVAFTPPVGGTHAGTIRFNWGPCDGYTDVPARGYSALPALELSVAALDFGTVNANQTGRRTVVLRNTGTAPRTVMGIAAADPSVHVVRPAGLPATLAPGDSLEIELEYAPTLRGTLASTLAITIADPCGQDTAIALSGTAAGDVTVETSLTVVVPEVAGAIDQVIDIPVAVEDWANVPALAPTAMRVTISYRYTLLLARAIATTLPGMTAQIVDQKIDGMWNHLTFDLMGTSFPSNGELAAIRFLVLVGDTDRTAIIVDSVRLTVPANRVVTVNKRDGAFHTLGVCQTGGSRFIRLGSSVRLKSVRPNPFHDALVIEFENDQEEAITATLYDEFGNPSATLAGAMMKAGTHTLQFDGSRLPSGLFVC